MASASNPSLTPDQFIGSNLRVAIKDGRVVTGILTVIDPFGNLLLSNVIEESEDIISPPGIHKRDIGLVSVPRETIVTVSVDTNTHRRLFSKK
ncbi:predicted protein [Scheffersomyces stipitis CBS 6054]|uniref:Sm domain-containing protein n=1 Tax=Scheffersomyces stipitis (strain ATCC 58785 / CBS 6054 / NBRC 10063 / NRRL Y-11545) TaxID=322104 RepID=A3LX11_PICST|nr:predicted protein [Scheffersomyces stipitis CBS 6054]ABN67380.1 predicted protein [Scheffersomyces stipitis CBS 6054]KAG2732035.1 hypothetical protein G9P44_004452 [Scheffersomyces stipitis]